MRRQFRFALGIAVLLLCITPASSKSYQALRYDVDLKVQAGGDLLVTETIDYQFEGGTFTYAFREVPVRESDGLDQFQGFMDGQELRIGAGEMPGLELQQRNRSVRIVWHFQPVSDSSHTFVVKYRARGAVRREDGQDLLSWRAIPGDRNYRIESARVTVMCPGGVSLAGEPGSNRESAIRQSEGVITFDVGRLNKERVFSVSVPFPLGSILSQPPLWQQQAERRSQEREDAAATAIAIVGPLFLVGLLAVIRLRPAKSVPKPVGPSVVTSPPDDLPPALVGMLLECWSDWRVALAALIDLGQKGFLEIEAKPKRWWTSRDFTLRRKGDPGALNPVEQQLLRLVFGTTEPHSGEVPLRKAQRQLQRHWGRFTRALREHAQVAGFADPERNRIRRKWIGWGITLMCLAVTGTGGVILGVAPLGRVLAIAITIAVGVAVFILGLLVVILGSTLTRLTDSALVQKQRWTAFRKHLKELASRKSPLQPEWLPSYLPYAVVMGLGNQWAKAYKDQGISAHLAWLAGKDQFEGSEVAALVAVLSTSGAGHSSPGGGGGGAAGGGGGSSGAG